MTDSKALSNLRKELSDEAKSLSTTLSKTSAPKIRLGGKMFKLPSGESHPGPINVVILDYTNMYEYYDKPYDQNNISPPACFAINKIIDNLQPMESAPNPQANSCAECPKSKWKSGPNGKGKACRQTVRLAVIPAGAGPESEVMLITVSPSGLKAWTNYANRIVNEFNGPPICVNTEISFNQNETYPTLLFDKPTPNTELETHISLRDSARNLLMTEPDAG